MYLIDYHSHSELSPDSASPLIENAKSAVAAGISELCTTDHFDLLTEDGQFHDLADLRWDERVAQHTAVKAALEGKLVLKLGIELGSGHEDKAITDRILSHPELDFVIGSLHNMPKEVGGYDYYNTRYTSTQQCYELLDHYFRSMVELVEDDRYDVLGHIIVMRRYMTVRDHQEFSFERYTDQIRTALKGAIARGKGIEFNTWNGRSIEEWRDVLTLYHELGGEFITVGADAHEPRSIGKGVRDAYEFLLTLGFRYVTTYEKRKPTQIKL